MSSRGDGNQKCGQWGSRGPILSPGGRRRSLARARPGDIKILQPFNRQRTQLETRHKERLLRACASHMTRTDNPLPRVHDA